MSSIRRAIVVDLGGVMVRVRHHWDEVAEYTGLSLRDTTGLAEDHILSAYQGDDLSEDDYLEAQRERFGLESVAEARLVHQSILVGPYDGTFEMVNDWVDAGFDTACLSNTSGLHWPILTDPTQYPAICALNERIASHIIGVNKPDLAAYHAVNRVLQADEYVFFDDGPVNVAEAIAAGWQGHVIDASGDPVAQMRAALHEMGWA